MKIYSHKPLYSTKKQKRIIFAARRSPRKRFEGIASQFSSLFRKSVFSFGKCENWCLRICLRRQNVLSPDPPKTYKYMRRQWILISADLIFSDWSVQDKKCPSRGGRNRTRGIGERGLGRGFPLPSPLPSPPLSPIPLIFSRLPPSLPFPFPDYAGHAG